MKYHFLLKKIIFKTDLCMFLGLKNETILNLNNLAN